MDLIAKKIVDKMISCDQKLSEKSELYVYMIELTLEKVVSYLCIFLLAVLFDSVLETIVFVIFFTTLRSRCGGIHAETYSQCLLCSVFMYIFTNWIAVNFLARHGQISVILSIGAMIPVLVIGNVNHENLHLSANEMANCRLAARIIVSIEAVSIVLLEILQISDRVVAFAALGEIDAMVLLLLQFIIQRKHRLKNEGGIENAKQS